MARTIKGGKPASFEDAVYMLDRNMIKVPGVKTRAEALDKFRKQFDGKSKSQDDGPGDDPPPDDEDEPADDYDNMNVDALRDELRDRDLPVGGNKSELIDRLREDDEFDG